MPAVFTRMKNTANNATMVRESNQDESRAMVITLNSGPIISPMMDAARKKDKNAAAVVSEETRSGTRPVPGPIRWQPSLASVPLFHFDCRSVRAPGVHPPC